MQCIPTVEAQDNGEEVPAHLAVCAGCAGQIWTVFQIVGQYHCHLRCTQCGVAYCPSGDCDPSNPHDFEGLERALELSHALGKVFVEATTFEKTYKERLTNQQQIALRMAVQNLAMAFQSVVDGNTPDKLSQQEG